jgi:hypothetical protein
MNTTYLNLRKACDYVKRQLQGIALILLSILFMIGFGDAPFFDLSFRWSAIFAIVGLVGGAITFLPEMK